MFKLNDEVYTKAGYPARIVCVDAAAKYGGNVYPVVALITAPASIVAATQVCYFYSLDGKYAGTGHPNYDLVSNEPTEEETKLIAEVRCLVTDPNSRDADERMLKVIRGLRAKK